MNQSLSRYRQILLLFAFPVLFISCYYYKATIDVSADAYKKAEKLKMLAAITTKEFILRNGNKNFRIINLKVSDNLQSIDCILDSVPISNRLYIDRGMTRHRRYKKNNYKSSFVVNEVHVYVTNGTPAIGSYTILSNDITRIDILEKDKARTYRSFAVATVGSGVIGVSLTVLLLANSMESLFHF